MSNTLEEFKDNLAKNLFGMTRKEAREKGICLECKNLAAPRCHSQAGKKEYLISAICEECFDKMFEGGAEERFRQGSA